ncbi:MAG: tRNA 4-thiouridine(8) synthase ThiI [Treponema sp.]|jgi:thiamine biosynthesis protein ThiI|nr:tRNA 4-thiouridine(8) synthase ThiI [Treponema sp.]
MVQYNQIMPGEETMNPEAGSGKSPPERASSPNPQTSRHRPDTGQPPEGVSPFSVTYLVKLGELVLKGGNREGFERILRRNLLAMLHARAPEAQLTRHPGRFYIRCGAERAEAVENVLSCLMGISGWARARGTGKTAEAVLAACVEEGKRLRDGGIRSFKVEARRPDKSFPLSSYDICRAAGDAVCRAVPELKVDVHNPGGIISVEIRERAWIYSLGNKGRRGLPVGSAGRGFLLLSGGIDSPVAGCLMAGRGMGLDAVYFHTPPYTSTEALEKVRRLAEITGSYAMGIRLYTVNFTRVQRRIREEAPGEWATVLLRMAMMEAATILARRCGAKCLITGESLSQVASQTIENLACAESRAGLPILRPLVGTDKEGIITMAKDFGTYDTSILPYPDCCVLFSPPHPVLRGNTGEAAALYAALELTNPGGPDRTGLLYKAVEEAELTKCGYYTPRSPVDAAAAPACKAMPSMNNY